MDDFISVEPFQERFVELKEREGLTLTEVARRAGWSHGEARRTDSSRAASVLGIQGSGKRVHKKISYENACKLARALDLDPVDVGI